MPSIFEQTGQPTQHSLADRELDLFQNRDTVIRHFLGAIHEADPRPKIIFLAGSGGSGKSLLQRFLLRNCCMRIAPDEWNAACAQTTDAKALVSYLSQTGKPVPAAQIDFGQEPREENRPKECHSALLMLKRQLAGYGIRFPRFDFGAICYLKKSGLNFGNRLHELFPENELGLASDIADFLFDLPILKTGRAVFDLIDRRTDQLLSEKLFARRLAKDEALAILEMPAEPQLANMLPKLFAEDVNQALHDVEEQQRIVLMFDTHESFWEGTARVYGTRLAGRYLAQDSWLRRLLGHLDLHAGCLPIVSGRDRPLWADAADARIPDSFLKVFTVGNLSDDDADVYLQSSGVLEAPLRRAIAEYASVCPGQVHPQFLALCADAAGAAQRHSKHLDCDAFARLPSLAEREMAMVRRFLYWIEPNVEKAVVFLAAARTFDLPLYQHLAADLCFAGTTLDFERVIPYSFIACRSPPSELAGGRPVYEMHRLLRRILSKVRRAEVQEAHTSLIGYYNRKAKLGDYLARLEAVYHVNQIAPVKGLRQLVSALRSEVEIHRYDRCRTIIALLTDIQIPETYDRGDLWYLLARANLGLGNLQEVEETRERLPTGSACRALIESELLLVKGQLQEAERLTFQALRSASPEDQGDLLYRLSEIKLYLGKFREGVKLSLTGKALSRASTSAPDSVRWRNVLGEFLFYGGDVEQAAREFTGALQDSEASALPTDLALKARLLSHLAGLIRETQHQWAAALALHQKAADLRRATGDIRGEICSLHGIGKAYRGLKQYEEALGWLGKAERFASTLGELVLLGKVYLTQAECLIGKRQYFDALIRLRRALSLFRHCDTPYDIAHTMLVLAEYWRQRGRHLRWHVFLEEARRMIEAGQFYALYKMFPAARLIQPEVIATGIRYYALGDALGVPWEGCSRRDVNSKEIGMFPRREDWESGATSDDTAQLLVLAELLAESGCEVTAREFVVLLARELPNMRGVGPSTRAAVQAFIDTGRVGANGGCTNGAAMRALPIGWIVPCHKASLRREVVYRLSKVTHGDMHAVASACVIAAMASLSVESASRDAVVAAGRGESRWLRRHGWLSEQAERAILSGRRSLYETISENSELDPVRMVSEVIRIIVGARSLEDALLESVQNGGDTDTRAALVGGILAPIYGPTPGVLAWQEKARLPDAERIATVAQRLCAERCGHYR
ncbi:hypothetical protein CKO31_10395 [Thiohalocapsa halophila]|uniref:Tetratricopeptide repeat protein n=1 Tax=Thiohalocapsa halophila TaxID=69359 RepID=A0ABS1CGU5_9GAMM|nr:ADP-ribosylglycohydrolase family protein [Thiohalocapsa halophila]MBK1631145.1 hypothetical protein [Thiohalocapsa halophila]